MNYLLTEYSVLYSKFLIFYLSCTNEQKFYSKKDKEYDEKNPDKWLKGHAPQLTIHPVKNGHHEPNHKILEPAVFETPELKTHVFLEDSLPIFLSHTGIYKRYRFDQTEPIKLSRN